MWFVQNEALTNKGCLMHQNVCHIIQSARATTLASSVQR